MIRLTLLSLIAAALAPLAAAQASYAPPRNAFGQPDLTGLWTNATVTQLERDPRFGDRLAMTEDEAKALKAGGEAAVMQINGEYRTSFLTSPANGRLPALTPEAKAARAGRLAEFPRGYGFARGDNPESYTLAERCLRDFGSSSGPPMMPVGYNNTYQIVQAPDHVMILVEMIHDARIIPLNAKHRPDAVQQWMGDSIGWYEGDTLVVETTGFRPNQAFRGGPGGMKVTERFRRVNDGQILYAFEIDDGKVFTAPIRAEIAMNTTRGPLFEYACHEGNYSFASMLGGQRAAETEWAAKTTR
jgi:hypothetical protein